MKRFILLFAVFLFSIILKAQQTNSLLLNLYGGYAFKDKVDFDGFYGYVDEAFEYGGGLEYFPQTNKSIELRYLRMDTHFPLYGPADTHLNSGHDKGSVNYILIGGTNYFSTGSADAKAMPYFGAGVGVGILSIKDGNSSTKFAWDAKLGIKQKTASAVSINVHAYVQFVISAVGSDYYSYPGYAVAVPDYASLFQFGLGGALCFNFKKK